MEFIIKSSARLASELKTILELVQRVMDNLFEELKTLHTKSQVSRNGKLVETEWMKAKFLAFMDEIEDLTNFQVSRINELSVADAGIKKELEKLQSRIAKLDELINMHDYWMVRADNIAIQDVQELNKVTNAMKAYKGKVITLKKA